MKMATFKAHSGKPIWARRAAPSSQSSTRPSATALILTGPGRYSLDRLFGIKVPRWLLGPADARRDDHAGGRAC